MRASATERFCRLLKQPCGVATRHDKAWRDVLAGVYAAATAILLDCGRALTLRLVGTAAAASYAGRYTSPTAPESNETRLTRRSVRGCVSPEKSGSPRPRATG